MPYSAVLHTTIGSRRRATRAAGSAAAGAASAGLAVSLGHTAKFGNTRQRLSKARAANTAFQPIIAPATAPSGAPSASDSSSPDTTSAIQLARRSGGAAPPISA